MYTVKSDKKHKTAILHSQDDRWEAIAKLFKHADIKGNMLLPDEDLYGQTLVGMASAMFEWLGIETDKRVYVDFSDDIGDAAGLYFESEGTHFILVNSKHQNNRYEAAAILAHELMHFCLIGEYNFRLEETLDNERLTDMATIYCGLGVVVLNGFEYSSGWATTVIGLMFGSLSVNTESMSFGYYKPKEYAKMLAYFADKTNTSYDSFSGYLFPWTGHFLPTKLNISAKANRNRSDLVVQGQSSVWKGRAIQLAIIVALIPVAILFLNWRYGGSGTSSSIPTEVQTQLNTQKTALDSLESQYNQCSADIKAREPNVDTTSQSAVDSYNAALSSCESVRVRYNQSVESYNSLLDKYK